jgi:pancreatic triacylglycerol lipase
LAAPTHDYQLVPDAEGNMHLLDLATYEAEPEPHFNAAADVIFRVFTRRNPTAGQIIQLNNAGSLSASNYRSSDPTRLIIHGWNNNGGSDVNTQIRTAFINRGEFNVITVDWGAGANTANYITARNRINEVGPVVAQFVDFLNLSGGMSFASVSIIGHSLGGHTAGIAGKRTSRGRVRSIIGMDAAGPLFHMNAPGERLHTTDGDYVEHIVTNGGTLGFMEPIAQANFYPAFGRVQPGCGIDLAGTCSHGRAFQFFAESVNSARFVARRCASFDQIAGGSCTASGGEDA